MSSEPQKLYPRGYIAMGNGDLIQVTNIKLDTGNGATQVHTLRRKGAGIRFGNTESTVSFDSAIDEDGSERDYLKMLQRGEIKQIRIKIPGSTMTVDGAVSSLSIDMPLDGEIKFSVTFVGRVEQS